MAEFAPLTDVADFASLDLAEFSLGVVAFTLGEPEPVETRARWVGWRAQAMHEGAIPRDDRLWLLAVEAAMGGVSMVGFG